MKHAYTVNEVAGLLSMSPQATRSLVAQVFEGPRDLLTFQDVVLLRTAKRVPKTKLREALARVKTELPAEAPLSSVTLQQVGKELVVNAGQAKWNASSGQQLFDLERSQGRGATWLRPVPSKDAEALYQAALALEETDAEAALERYADAVAADPHHADAHVNLGRLLHAQKRFREAEAHYVAALVARPTDATASFNLAVVLEDLGRFDDAIARYQETLELDPTASDACFNLARLYEKKGEKVAALRHLKDYRRLSGPR